MYYNGVLRFTEKLYVPEECVSIVVSSDDPNGTSLMLKPNHNAIAKHIEAKFGTLYLQCLTSKRMYERLRSPSVRLKRSSMNRILQ
jgi:hypothetical protein